MPPTAAVIETISPETVGTNRCCFRESPAYVVMIRTAVKINVKLATESNSTLAFNRPRRG